MDLTNCVHQHTLNAAREVIPDVEHLALSNWRQRCQVELDAGVRSPQFGMSYNARIPAGAPDCGSSCVGANPRQSTSAVAGRRLASAELEASLPLLEAPLSLLLPSAR